MKLVVAGLKLRKQFVVVQVGLQQIFDVGADVRQLLDVFGLGMQGGQGTGVAFQGGAQLKNFIDLGHRQLGHKGAPAGLAAHQTVGGQAAQTVTHRGARDAHPLCQFFLDHALPRLVFARQDQAADGLVGEVAGAGHGGWIESSIVYK